MRYFLYVHTDVCIDTKAEGYHPLYLDETCSLAELKKMIQFYRKDYQGFLLVDVITSAGNVVSIPAQEAYQS